jgi:hypothetical protein
VNISGADAGMIREAELVDNASAIEGRQNSPTSVCTRWAQQGTLKTQCLCQNPNSMKSRMSMELFIYTEVKQLPRVGKLRIHGVSLTYVG